MRRTTSWITVAGLSVAVVACGRSGSSKGGATTTSTAAPSGATVVIQNIKFNPDTLALHAGESVTWLWKDDSIPHNVDGKAELPDLYSGSPKTGGSYSYTFTKAGTYHIVCDVHPVMKLTVTVT